MNAPAITTTLPAATVQKAWSAAQDFEAMALNQFLAPMFDTVDMSAGPLGGGEGESAWKPMLIDALAKQITHGRGMGIAQPVFRQMIQMQEARQGAGQGAGQ
jgi:Rod binding domain-containing protein